MLNKKELSEQDIRTKYITPALLKAGWDLHTQLREEVGFTDGRIIVDGRKTKRGKRKVADYILYYKPNIPVAIIEAKDNNHSVMAGIQQGLDYATVLDIPSVYSSNGDGFYEHDRTLSSGEVERELGLDKFPSPAELWERYKKYKGIESDSVERIAAQDYFFDASATTKRETRYYQQIAINRSVEAVAKGQKRLLLTMATGTGKTYTAFQIIHRLWKAGVKKRILFLADRHALIGQTKRGDFRHFKDKMTIIENKTIDKSYEIYLALYQGLTNYDSETDAFREFSREFFDLIVIDECHRGSASEDSAWRKILDYFHSATHIGLTATPKETETISSTEYFGEPIYTYTLKQGIQDGFLAPYEVIRVGINVDDGWTPEAGKLDKSGNPVENREYNRKDFDNNTVIDERTQTVANRITEFLKSGDRFRKTIVFCVDIEHAERMRAALAKANSDLMAENPKYVMQITGDNEEGKRELDNFIDPEEPLPVIAVTSKLMTTGIDAQTCKLLVIDKNINSMTEFKQIIGRGTRINEAFDKTFFTTLDFRNATVLFFDQDFDGDPIRVKEVVDGDPIGGIDEAQEDGENPDVGPEDEDEDEDTGEPRAKVYIDGVDVKILNERLSRLDEQGNTITTSLKEYAREKIRGQFKSLDSFITEWNSADRKRVLIDAMRAQGCMIDELMSATGKNMDIFDTICHVAYDRPPRSRAERTNQVKKRDVFTKYGEQARMVLYALLDKYADEGVQSIEDMDILRVKPLEEFGSAVEIVEFFGGRDGYLQAVAELEEEIYKEVA